MKIRAGAKFLKMAMLDFLFPVFCVSCQKEGFWICSNCLAQTEIQDFQYCPACENSLTEMGRLCPFCRDAKKSSLDALIVAASYDNHAVKKLVHNLKYRFVAEAAEPLAKLICRSLIQCDCPLPGYIVPVPLHSRRLRWRGFNQSLLVARHISRDLAPHLDIDVLDILERKKCTPPQMGIKNYQARLQNVKDIFGIKPKADCPDLKNGIVLLVDDIATTGATLQECARVLKETGARKVFAAVVARQTLKK